MAQGEANKSEGEERPICNICRQDDSPANLISPCACRGTNGYVHFGCIKIWIETSGTDVCRACKHPYSGLNITKRPGKFEVFFYESEAGPVYAWFTPLFFFLFYVAHLTAFHCRIAYHTGFKGSAITLTILNIFFLSVHTVFFHIYLAMIYFAFTFWRESHFALVVNKPT